MTSKRFDYQIIGVIRSYFVSHMFGLSLFWGVGCGPWPGGSLRCCGLFSGAIRRRKRSRGSAFAWGSPSGFSSRINGPRRPARVCVLSGFVGDAYWGTGRSSCSLLLCGRVQWDLCWGAGSISIPLIRFRIFLPAPPTQNKHQPLSLPVNCPW